MGAAANFARVTGLFIALIGIFMVFGWILGTYYLGNPVLAMIIFLALAAVFNAIGYFAGPKMVLWSYRAKIVSEKEAPRLHRIVNEISEKSGIPKPQVAIIPTHAPNAFATGRNPDNAVVAATDGLLSILDDKELKGVMAHEIAHIKDRDMLVMTVAATIAGAIAFLARVVFWSMLFGGRDRNVNPLLLIAAMITAPIAAMLLQMAISRSREYKADRVGGLMIKDPLSLASALKTLERENRRKPMQFGNPASSSLFIVNPFSKSIFVSLFSTHPRTEDRVKKLEDLYKEMNKKKY